MSELNKEVMVSSYSNISFYGEKRGVQDFEYYTELLKEDLEQLGENKGNYKAKFIDKVMTIFHRQMSCASAFICGPANFDNTRNQKKWDSRDKAYSDFDYWRNKYFKAVNRVRTLSPEAELDAIPRLLDFLTLRKESYKEFNKLMKKAKVNEAIKVLEDSGVKEEWVKDFVNDGYIPSYRITSITTKIRETKKKIEVMKSRIEAKKNQKPVKFEGGSIYIENDRVIISHEEKPEKEIIQAIKKNGFRWSPKFGSWCRKHTANARRDANYLLNNVFGGELS